MDNKSKSFSAGRNKSRFIGIKPITHIPCQVGRRKSQFPEPKIKSILIRFACGCLATGLIFVPLKQLQQGPRYSPILGLLEFWLVGFPVAVAVDFYLLKHSKYPCCKGRNEN